ncbi:MAG: DUF3828 domain-containing protein [Rhodopseudomonas sp.]|uniref:DUF3828 domain-containing protein n=1 Tax=Rhodopseudomonas sp. TaxID=1078 RepID=UPI0017B95686|nr:DUF3828 domain-containing protein [Rhodopseudomonas sp.]NVN86435.1 DUF3828 domain-containing protein [Rhodopseudomonas sp.]
MLTRRSFAVTGAATILAATALALPAVAAPAANDPVAIVTALYDKAIKDDNRGGDFANVPAARAKVLSKSFAALWLQAEARTPKGDAGPIDFDPVSNSQDPGIKSVSVKVESKDSGTATLAVTLIEGAKRNNPADAIVRYDFVRDGGHWRIDDIRGSVEGKPWSIRDILRAALKS